MMKEVKEGYEVKGQEMNVSSDSSLEQEQSDFYS